MQTIPQWFVWELRWDASAGKFSKAPWCNGRKVDASLPANWMSYADAVATLRTLPQALELRYALGFWLTAHSGYFLLDLDHALGVDGQWRPFAQQMVAAYPGAMCEVSSSSIGLHVIGRTSAPAHRNKPPREIAARLAPLQLELYTADRGICFGLDGHAQGCADAAFDLAPLVSSYFPPHAPGDYNGQRMAQWRGPASDDVLIERALRAKQSAAAAFGGKASFADLWHGRTEKNSEADAALTAHLAWWTGADAPRIERLARRSLLVRAKWDERRGDGTYLSLTIQRACELCTSCYIEPQQALPMPAPQTIAPRVQRASDLLKRQFKPVQWAVHGILPQGVTILSGSPKTGKSFMAYQMCIAVASGRPLWEGRAPEVQGDALYLDLEGTERRLQDRLTTQLTAFPGADVSRLHYATEWERADAGVTQLRKYMTEFPHTRLIVIDTISAWRENEQGRTSAYAHDYMVGETIKPLVRDYDVAVVLVAHNRKAHSEDWMQSVSGTQGLTGSVDGVLSLERVRGAADAALHIDGRDIKDPADLALRFEGGRWRYVGSVADVQRSQERTAVLQAIRASGGAATKNEIRAHMPEKSDGAVKTMLSKMIKSGEVKLDNTIYTLAVDFTPVPPPNPTGNMP